jgi:hypothetical protein
MSDYSVAEAIMTRLCAESGWKSADRPVDELRVRKFLDTSAGYSFRAQEAFDHEREAYERGDYKREEREADETEPESSR